MQLVIFFTLIAFGSAAQLPSKTYLPSNQGAQGILLGSQGHSQGSFVALSHQSSSNVGVTGETGNRRSQQEVEKNAVVLKQNQEISENGDFHYSYETSNGIQASEAGSTASFQGGFSYIGDDGKNYTVSFTAGKDGFRPQGAHLPQLPEDMQKIILASLEQNAKDEAAGIFDDGKYRPEVHGPGSKDRKGQSSASFSSSSSISTGYSSVNHRGTFNSNTGYRY